MGRECKFRAWTGKEMMVPRYLVSDDTDCMHVGSTWHDDYEQGYMDGGIFAYKKYELMQFTCLTDRNGIEVYENDVVEISTTKERGQVIWRYSGWDIELAGDDEGYPVTDSHSYAVIGNIYESPELLTPRP